MKWVILNATFLVPTLSLWVFDVHFIISCKHYAKNNKLLEFVFDAVLDYINCNWLYFFLNELC